MKKYVIDNSSGKGSRVRVILLTMKLLTILMFAGTMAVSASVYSQKTKIDLQLQNSTVGTILKSIESRSEFIFFYDIDLISTRVEKSISVRDANIETVLEELFGNSNIAYFVDDRQVFLYKKDDIKQLENLQGKNRIGVEQPQKKEISGTVKDNKSLPLPGVTVVVKGTTIGTITNNYGKFKFTVPVDGKIIVFSFVGMKSQEIDIEGKTNIAVILEEENQGLEEVVVVGYDKQRKSSVVSAISSVKGKELRMPTRSLSAGLAGQVSGLIAIQRSAEPGYDNAEFWIRGISTFAGGKTPLVLVDGVPRSINDIEPDEIESFSVLKDAAATAVYGAEGANGVVIITSKRGVDKIPVISFRTEHSISTPTRLPKFVDAADYMSLYNEALFNDGVSPLFSDDLIANYRNNVDPDLYPNVDWIDALLKKNILNHRYTLNVRGGSDKVKYFVSGAYFGEEGYFKDNPENLYKSNVGLKRFNLRSNIDIDISKTTKVSVDLSGQYLITSYPGTLPSVIFNRMTITPSYIFPAVYSDGTLSTYMKERDGNMKNPYNLLYQSGYSKNWNSGIQSGVRLDQKLDFITEGLTYKAMVSYDYDGLFGSTRTYNPSRYYATGRDNNNNLIFSKTVSGSPDLSEPVESNSANKKIYFENSFNYNRTFGKHTVGGMILYMQKEQQYHNEALAFRKQGVIGRATYSFANRYFVEGNFGYTGSETFAKGSRFGFFPALGLGYMISNESYYPESLKKAISSLKLRLSVGRTGNDNTGGARFLYRPTFNLATSGFNQGMTNGGGTNGYGSGITEARFDAPYLSWEIENKKDLGVNIGFLNNKIQFVGDYFNSERSGILLQRKTVPQVAGFREAPWLNYGTVKNNGFDGSLDGSFPVTDDFTIGIRSTFTYARNKITEYDELEQPYPWMAVTGTRVGENTLYIAERLYTEDDFTSVQNTNGTYSYTLKPGIPLSSLGGLLGPGDIKYKDLNGDGKIDMYDMKRGVGNPSTPEIVYGFGLNLQYKGFYASAFFQGTGNCSVVLGQSNIEGWMPFWWGLDQSNYRTFALDRWSPTGGDDQHPLMTRLHYVGAKGLNNKVASTWRLRNGAFMRLKNVEFGYNIPDSFLKKYNVRSARIYMMGYNLALWDHIKYWDPETGNNNAGNAYPNSRSFTLGLELSF